MRGSITSYPKKVTFDTMYLFILIICHYITLTRTLNKRNIYYSRYRLSLLLAIKQPGNTTILNDICM